MTTQPPIHCGPCIITRYLGATDTKGSRVKATFNDGNKVYSATVPYEDSEDIAFLGDGPRSAHYNAVLALFDKMHKLGRWTDFRVIACGHDDGPYYWVVSGGNYTLEAGK